METRKPAWTYGNLLRTALLLVAAIVAANYKVPTVAACATCRWTAGVGYSCVAPGSYDWCLLFSADVPCDLGGEGCIE